MIRVSEFEKSFEQEFPETCDLLRSANLQVDPRVYQIILHGSRGPAGGHDDASDIDLSFVVDDSGLEEGLEHDTFLKALLEETLEQWTGPVEPDLTAIFDSYGCHMPCLSNPRVNVDRCPHRGIDCFGAYRIQRRTPGYGIGHAMQVKRMRPCITIWRSQTSS